jgi:hypothetical protein
MPLAGPPVVDDANTSLAVASAEGYVFRFNEAAIRQRVQDEPVASEMIPAHLPPFVGATGLGQGRAVFSAPGSNRLLLYNPAQAPPAKWLTLESPIACPVTSLGPGFLAPLAIGQVFYLNSADGSRLAVPFQPRLDPQTTLAYKPAAAVGKDGRQFVITDGLQKIYLVAVVDTPQPHLEEVKQADVGPHPIESPLVALGDEVIAVAGGTHLLRFHLPTLKTVGETNLPAPLEWGPYPAGDIALLATADHKLIAVSAGGETKWQTATNQGPLAGPPLLLPDGVLLAYRKGIIERRSIVGGKPLATVKVEQPLATSPVEFLQHLVVATADGTLLVVDKPLRK